MLNNIGWGFYFLQVLLSFGFYFNFPSAQQIVRKRTCQIRDEIEKETGDITNVATNIKNDITEGLKQISSLDTEYNKKTYDSDYRENINKLPNKEANKNEAEPDAEQKKESDQKTSLPDSMPVE
jgi:gas vesicle protein